MDNRRIIEDIDSRLYSLKREGKEGTRNLKIDWMEGEGIGEEKTVERREGEVRRRDTIRGNIMWSGMKRALR